MKIFLTGGTGFVGRAILNKLADAGHELVVLTIEGEHFSPRPNCGAVVGDITRKETLKGKIEGCDALIHLAGAVGYGQSWENCRRLNIDGTINVAEAAIESGIKRIIHFSSVSVYGRRAGVILNENAPAKKIGDPYGDTKIEAEKFLVRLGNKLDLTIIRPTVIYGPGDDKFLPKLMENINNGGARIIGAGKNKVDLIHVEDVADFVELILDNEKTFGKTYNLTNHENPTWAEMMAHISAELGAGKKVKKLPYPAAYVIAGILEAVSKLSGRPPRLTRYAARVIGKEYNYSTERMRSELGFSPKTDLLAGISAEIAEMRRRAGAGGNIDS